MNYAAIKKTDVANGPGIRVSLFVSGCTHRCKGCFNSEAWDFQYGQEYTKATEEEILEALAPEYIRGLSLLGGEPMEPENRGTVLSLVKKVRQIYPEKDIWCYTGYDYEKDLLQWMGQFPDSEKNAEAESSKTISEDAASGEVASEETVPKEAVSKEMTPRESIPGLMMQLLSLIDVLVDGEFVEEKKNLRLAFRGSENQRLIDVKESLRQNRTVCL